MSILGFLFKPKKEMAKKGTPRVHMGKYTVSSHAQNRVADPKRDLKKTDGELYYQERMKVRH